MVHSSAQWEHRGHTIDVRSKQCGGTQCVTTSNGYVIPIQVRNGLPYIEMRPPTDNELHDLPHVIVTSDLPWNPSVINCDQTIVDMDDLPCENPYGIHHPFDREGNFKPLEIYSLDIGNGMYVEMHFNNYVQECVKHAHDWKSYVMT